MQKKDDLSTHEQKRILDVASCLFKPKQVLNQHFCKQLNAYTLKKAYLSTIKLHHPSKHPTESLTRRQERITFLEKATAAFKQLSLYVDQGFIPQPKPSKNTIIAVGGAKGGIGKSLLAANMAVYLCQQGYRVVAIDLDLGGANLSLYLGEQYILNRTINDFLHRRFNTLEEIVSPCKHGPLMIGGDSSELGMANIAHVQKLKLIRNIQELDTDFVILDLGGDTSYNMLDFFLMADCGYVMTTKDSASYIGAYQFLKTALYRKLRRLAGPEAGKNQIKSGALTKLIQRETTPTSSGIQCILDLCEHIDNINPLYTPLVLQPIIEFNPYLVVNKVTKIHQARQSAQTISALSEKALAIHLPLAGHLSRNDEIDDNLRNFEPMVASEPKGLMAQEIQGILQKSELLSKQ